LVKIKLISTFNHYFKALELELKENKDLNNNISYFDVITLEDGEKIYINKYANEAMIFFQGITKINAPTKYTAQSHTHYVDEKILKSWKNWYVLNNNKMKWSKRDKKPYIE
jgi:hypothetical protein